MTKIKTMEAETAVFPTSKLTTGHKKLMGIFLLAEHTMKN
jgi:hypothetical protein